MEIKLTKFFAKFCVRFFPNEKEPEVIDIYDIKRVRITYTKKFRDREIEKDRYKDQVKGLVFKIKIEIINLKLPTQNGLATNVAHVEKLSRS